MRKLKILRRWRKKSLYQKSLILFTVLLLVLSALFLLYVRNSMIIYERNLVDNYVSYLAESGKLTKDIDDNLFEVSKYEKKNAKISDGIKKIFKSKDLQVKKNTLKTKEDTYVYDLKLDDKVLSTVALKSVNTYRRMGILQIDEWDVLDVETNFENGIYNYKISIPSNYKLYINGNEIDNSLSKSSNKADGLERLSEYVKVSKNVSYEIDNLVYKPEIKILDEKGNKVTYQTKDNSIVVNNDFKEVKDFNDAKKYIKDDFDPLKLAKDYSLFLTNDLGGERHGFYKLSPYLIKDSYMYEYMWGWATQVDITFVSNHVLKNPTFTNESVKNCIIYSDEAFSCEVYLEKNMLVKGEDRKDVMHDRLFFVYYEGSYKLVDMKAIKD